LLRKIFKILSYTLAILLVLVLMASLLIQTSFVQNWLVHKAANTLSENLGTKVLVKGVHFSLFDKLQIEGIYIQDKNKDTLLYAGKINVLLTDWFFTKEKIILENISLSDATIYLHRKDSIWNYQYIVDYFSSSSTQKKKPPVAYSLKKLSLSNIRFLQKDEWRGEDQALHLRSLILEANDFNFNTRIANIQSINITDPLFSIYNYTGLRPKQPAKKEDSLPVVYSTLRWNPLHWQIKSNHIRINNGTFKSDEQTSRAAYYYFDGQHILFTHINSQFSNVSFFNDTLQADISITTQERSGLTINSFTANAVMHPEAMTFDHLDIRTARSHLQHFFAMRYHSFSDMNQFLTKVRMKGIFKDAVIHSDDIAYFTPALDNWKRDIQLTGTVSGTVDDLSAKSVILEAGKNTYLNGDIDIKDLSSINKTYINFHSNDFRTTYSDATTLLPVLKEVTEVRLDQLQYIRFKGNYVGYFNNFTAFGEVVTALGAFTTDVKMEFPSNLPTLYTGKINTHQFNVGAFINNSKLGTVSFNGSVQGSGLSVKNIKASLDGNIENLKFNGYNYKDITVKGTLSNKLFNGHLVVNDGNLGVHLDGLVDFSQQQPHFDFLATLDKANLKRLKLYEEDIDLAGSFLFNFTGSNIDNFFGSAKIFNAAIFKDGRRIAFDSLSLTAKQINNNKSIVAVSNEFDAAIAGNFSIKELPAAFQTFLHHYYPSYINPARKKVTDQNFSFVITTKKVGQYLDVFDKHLKGFNFSNLSGRINTKENAFDIDAEVPQFSYNSTVFNKVNLKGRGSADSLLLATQVGEVFVNDSLHFPSTIINVRSSNNVSKVQITTSANQTLNSANISGTLTTLENGFNVVFDPSNFEINGKRWTIDKNSDITLSKSIVTSDGVKIYSGHQEILISSQFSEVSNGTDLAITLKKINIGDFTPFFIKTNRLEGLLNGTIAIADPFGKMNVSLTADAEAFKLDNDSIGKLQLSANYAKANGKINIAALSENESYNFDLSGIVNIADSTGTGIDITAHPKKVSIAFLEQYLSDIFSHIQGYAGGDLRIVGKANNLQYLGKLALTDGKLTVNYTQCTYHIPTAIIKMEEDGINFGNFVLKDDLNNTGELLYGKLYHSNFKDMAYDFKLKTDQLLLLNTHATDNKQFYGRAIGKASFSFTGSEEAMDMDIAAEPTDSSDIFLPIGSSGQVTTEPNYLSWKVYGTEMQQNKTRKSANNLNVVMDMTANNFAKINVILDDAAGDKITALGHGKIRLTSTKEDLTLNGRFDVDKGDYTFTFQSIPRRFELQKNAINYISWNKNPYDADIKIGAIYNLNRVRFSSLGINSNGLGAVIDDNVKNYEGPLQVIANISEKLQSPKIKFDIKIPDNSPIANDLGANSLLDLIRRDENELNKQVSLLVVFNNFGPLSSNRNNGAGLNVGLSALEGIVVNSISGIISNALTKQFSSFFQNVLKDPTIRVNVSASVYSSSNLTALTGAAGQQAGIPFLNRSNVNFSVSKNYFNERLTFIVGSALDFGLNGNANNNSSRNFQFLPDVTAQWKLTTDGKFLMNLFYRENASYLGASVGKQSRSGASISYRREFDTFNELLRPKNGQ
jgi:hypothetical protein